MHLFMPGLNSTFNTLFIIKQISLECRSLASALAHSKDIIVSIFCLFELQ